MQDTSTRDSFHAPFTNSFKGQPLGVGASDVAPDGLQFMHPLLCASLRPEFS